MYWIESPETNTGAALAKEKRPRRLPAVDEPDEQGERREDEEDDGKGDGDVEKPFQDAVEGTFERLLPQADEAHASIFKKENRTLETFGNVFFDVIDDQQADAELFALRANRGRLRNRIGHFQQDDLGRAGDAGQLCQIGRPADNWPGKSVTRRGFVRDQADDIDTVLRFSLDPRHHASSLRHTSEQKRLLAPAGVEQRGSDEARERAIQGRERPVKNRDE